jgi:RNA polymerase sigma factor for flagellar operon FliA
MTVTFSKAAAAKSALRQYGDINKAARSLRLTPEDFKKLLDPSDLPKEPTPPKVFQAPSRPEPRPKQEFTLPEPSELPKGPPRRRGPNKRTAKHQEKYEKAKEALIQTGGKKMRAAHQLGISFNTLSTYLSYGPPVEIDPERSPLLKDPMPGVVIRPQTEEEKAEFSRKLLELKTVRYLSAKTDSNRNALIEAAIPLITSIIRTSLLIKHQEMDSLISVVSTRLIKYLPAFDPLVSSIGNFIGLQAKYALGDEAREVDTVSRHQRKLLKVFNEARNWLQLLNGVTPSEQHVFDYLSWEKRQIDLYREGLPTLSLSDPTYTHDSGRDSLRENLYTDPKSEQPTKNHEREMLLDTMTRNCSFDEKLILYLYHFKDHKFAFIGEILHLSESRISQIHSKVVKAIQTKFSVEDLQLEEV